MATWSCLEVSAHVYEPSAAPRGRSRALVPPSPCFAPAPRGVPARAAVRNAASAPDARPAPTRPAACPPLDDKLIVTKGHPVEQVTDPLTNVDCGDFFHV